MSVYSFTKIIAAKKLVYMQISNIIHVRGGNRNMIGYDRLWLKVIGSCNKSRLLFSCERSAWIKKMMASLTICKQLTRLDITMLCYHYAMLHIKLKRVCDSVYRDLMTMTRISWLLKSRSEHQFTIKTRCLLRYVLHIILNRKLLESP